MVMSFQIERGLFVLDFTDHHAILGVPVDAEIKDIRKRYLKIARRLHPDSFSSESESDKQRASELLSKLVNPAWEKLSQERDRSEYLLLLKLKGQQGIQKKASLDFHGNLAKQLLTASNPDHFYQTSLKGLADKQYEHLDQSLELTAQISELNLVYLMRKESQGESISVEQRKTLYTGSNLPDSSQSSTRPTAGAKPAAQQPQRESVAAQYYRRAQGYVEKNSFAPAVRELREALQIEPNNSKCHSLLGMVYLRQNQSTMAKIHFKKALQLDPNDEMAQVGLQRMEPGQHPAAGGKSTTTGKTGSKPADQKGSPPKPPGKPGGKPGKPDDKAGGGGLFGLFGKKK